MVENRPFMSVCSQKSESPVKISPVFQQSVVENVLARFKADNDDQLFAMYCLLCYNLVKISYFESYFCVSNERFIFLVPANLIHYKNLLHYKNLIRYKNVIRCKWPDSVAKHPELTIRLRRRRRFRV